MDAKETLNASKIPRRLGPAAEQEGEGCLCLNSRPTRRGLARINAKGHDLRGARVDGKEKPCVMASPRADQSDIASEKIKYGSGVGG